jgi:hypothetical protein
MCINRVIFTVDERHVALHASGSSAVGMLELWCFGKGN